MAIILLIIIMIINKDDDSIPIGISLPSKIVDAVDKKRKDVSRSRYILRILENHIVNKNNNKASFEDGLGPSHSNETYGLSDKISQEGYFTDV